MANYARTYLRISGSKSDVESAIDSIYEGEKLQLENLAPVPENINSDISCGWHIKDIDYQSLSLQGFQKALEELKTNTYVWHDKVVKQEGNKFWYVRERETIPDQRVFNDSQVAAIVKSYEQTGYPSREEFVMDQWGSGYSWQRDEERPEIEEYLDGFKAAIHFESKWQPPFKLLEKLSTLYPNLTVYISISLEMEYNTHIIILKNGERVSEFYGDNSYIFYGDGSKHPSESTHEINIFDSNNDCLVRYENEILDYLDTTDDFKLIESKIQHYTLTIKWSSIINADEFVRHLIEKNANDNALIEYKESALLPIDVEGKRYDIVREAIIHGTKGNFNGFAEIIQNDYVSEKEAKAPVSNMKSSDQDSLVVEAENKVLKNYKPNLDKAANLFTEEFDEDKWFIINDKGEKIYNPDYKDNDAPF